MENGQRIDFTLLLVTLVLACLGLVMVYSSSMYVSMDKTGSAFSYVKQQAIHFAIGFLAMIFLTQLNYRGFLNIRKGLLIVGYVLLFAVIIQNHFRGYNVNMGLRLGPLVFQPSELMKIILIVFLSGSIAQMGEQVRNFTTGFLPLLGWVLFTFALIFVQPDFGISSLILAIGFYLLFIGRAKLGHILLVVLPAAVGALLLVTTVPYMRKRLMEFLNPEMAYQIKQSIISIGSGGLFGVGLGNSTQKYYFLPEMHTDFVFSILGEELGFIGTMGLLALTFAFIMRGMRIARMAPDMFGFLLASGLTMMTALQVFINIGVAIRLLPTTGMTLPFISYGGTSLVVSFMMVGILLNISKQGNAEMRLSREFGSRTYRKSWT
jgi:cell division protein FtsW